MVFVRSWLKIALWGAIDRLEPELGDGMSSKLC